jgi:hypothetical protein
VVLVSQGSCCDWLAPKSPQNLIFRGLIEAS